MGFFDTKDWENPYWLNPENGLHWYYERHLTEYCKQPLRDLPILDAVVFSVFEKKSDGKYTLDSYVFIDRKTERIIDFSFGYEAALCKIDFLRALVVSSGES